MNNIHSTQFIFLSTSLFDLNYQIFIHEKNGDVYEIKLGPNNTRTNRDIKKSHNLLKLWQNGEKDVFMIGNIDEILGKATAKLKEMYGDDFKFEEDDEFVFALNNGVLFISFDEGIKIKIMLDTVIPLDMDFDLKCGEG